MINAKTKAALKALRQSGPCAEGLLRDFALRKRARTEISVDSIVRKIRLPRSKVIATFKMLEGLGLGCFIKGSRGSLSRFRFTTPAPKIGQAAF